MKKKCVLIVCILIIIAGWCWNKRFSYFVNVVRFSAQWFHWAKCFCFSYTCFASKCSCAYSVHRQFSLLSLLTVVLFGFVWPFAYISAGGLYTEAEKAAVIWPLGAGIFFPLTTANSPKRGKTKFPDDAVPLTTSSLKHKFWEISGNLNWQCYFEGLMTYIITLYVLLSPPVLSELGWWLCWSQSNGSWIPPKHTFYLQPSAYRLRTEMHTAL